MSTASQLIVRLMTQAILFLVPSIVILNRLGKRVPLDVKEFGADLKRHAALLLLFLVHRVVASSMAQVLYLRQTPEYVNLLWLWQIGVPLLVLVYYVVRSQTSFWDLRFAIALGVAFYAVDTFGLFAIVARHDMGWWVVTHSVSQGIDAVQLLKYIMLSLAYYAWVSTLEELFFRVTLFELLKKWGITLEATVVTLTGVLFGIFHITHYFQATTDVARLAAIINVFSATVMGLVLGLVYSRRRNLLHVSFLHWWVWVSNIGAQVVTGLVYRLLHQV